MVLYDGGGGANDPGLIAVSLRGGLVLGGCTVSDERLRAGQCGALRDAAGDFALQDAEANAGAWTKAGAALARDLLTSAPARSAYDFTYRWGPIVASVGCYGASFAVSAGALAIACTVGLSAAESVIVAIEYRRGNKGSAGVQGVAAVAGTSCALASTKLGPAGRRLEGACVALVNGIAVGNNLSDVPKNSRPHAYFTPGRKRG